ncbi:hypothetical protein AAMO2058_000018200 [Amorphochlora amoebiformis]
MLTTKPLSMENEPENKSKKEPESVPKNDITQTDIGGEKKIEIKAAPTKYHKDLNHKDGYLNCLTDKQKQALKDIKIKITEEKIVLEGYFDPEAETQDLILLRFLRARNFEVKKAYKLLSDDIAWRKDKDVKSLKKKTEREVLGCDPKLMHTHLPVWHQGCDKQGRPVIYKIFGNFQIWEVTKHTSLEKLIDHHLWQMESYMDLTRENSKKFRHIVETVTVVVDAKDWRLSLFTKEATKFLYRISKVDSDHFPERMGRLIVVNAPYLLSVAWKVIRGWLDPKTQKKVQIVRGPNEYEPILKDWISESSLCDEYGGKAKSLRVTQNR